MPTFNQANYIGNAISSVLSQTEKSFELIIVNNYSSDNTVKIVKSFNDSRIKLFNFKNHGIIAASRNLGIKKSKGDYIAFLDSDDIWYSNKLQSCLKFIKKGHKFISHKVHFKNRKDHIIKIGLKNYFSHYSLLYKGNFIVTSSVVVNSDILKKLNGFNTDPSMINSEDFDLWLRILKYEKGYLIPETLGENIIHQFNASRDIEKSFSAAKNVLNSFLKNENFLKKRKSLGFLSYSFGMAYFKKNKFKLAINTFIEALKYHPLLMRCYFLLVLLYIIIIFKFLKVSK